MRLGTGHGQRAMQRVIRLHLEQYILERPDGNIGALGESRSTNSNPTANLWLFSATEIPLDTDFGERLTGRLNGLTLPGENVQAGDRLSWNGDKYRVEEVADIQDQPYVKLGLERAVNE